MSGLFIFVCDEKQISMTGSEGAATEVLAVDKC